ncbi:MAG TPA: hypothetical protein VF240_04785 [Pyrinomonadaceae bacterium]
MKKYPLTLSAACALLLFAAQAVAQTLPPPPNVLVFVREDIKPGKMPAHNEEAANFVRVQTKANTVSPKELRDYRLAMVPIAGNENEVTYVWGYNSFEEMENKRREADRLANGPMKADFDALVDRDLHAAQHDIITTFRPDLSHGLGRVDIAQARYTVMTTLRIKPGHEEEYWNAVKKHVYPARDKTAMKNASWAVFAVRAGMPGSSYIILRPVKSLAEFDAASPATVRGVMSGDEKEEMDKVSDRSILLTNTNYYAFSPRLSLVTPEWAARDTASTPFWNPKPQAADPTTSAGSRPAGSRRRP